MKNKIILLLIFFLIIAISLSAQIFPTKKGMVGLQIYELDKRFYVGKVFKNSPAERAGFQNEDEILQVGDVSVKNLTIQQVLDLFDGDPGAAVDVKINRKDQILSMNVSRVSPDNLFEDSTDFKNIIDEQLAVEGLHEKSFSLSGLMPEELELRWSKFFEEYYGFSGFLIDSDFTQKLGTFFNEGLLVCFVDKSSPAASTIKRWDLITKIENTKVSSYFQNSQLINITNKTPLSTLNITVMSITGEVQTTLKPKPIPTLTPIPAATNKTEQKK